MRRLLLISMILVSTSCGIFNKNKEDKKAKEAVEAPKHRAPDQQQIDETKKEKTQIKQLDVGKYKPMDEGAIEQRQDRR